jgi:hypothetical protein
MTVLDLAPTPADLDAAPLPTATLAATPDATEPSRRTRRPGLPGDGPVPGGRWCRVARCRRVVALVVPALVLVVAALAAGDTGGPAEVACALGAGALVAVPTVRSALRARRAVPRDDVVRYAVGRRVDPVLDRGPGARPGPRVLVERSARGKVTDLRFVVGGRVFRMRVHDADAVRRRTLLDDAGDAWLVRATPSGAWEAELPGTLTSADAAALLTAVSTEVGPPAA